MILNDDRIMINIYGAFDRFNYGDLLFPIIIKMSLDERLGQQEYKYYGLIDTDLSNFGGVPTLSIRRLIKRSTSEKRKETLIVAGGEVLHADIYYLHQCLIEKDFLRKILRRIRKKYGEHISNKLSGRMLSIKLEYPFILNKEMLPGVSKIIYNSVGGFLPKVNIEAVKIAIKKADYISVRDRVTYNEIKKINPRKKIKIAPDSATVMSKYFSKSKLNMKANLETQKLMKMYDNGYICFQISSYHFNLDPEEIHMQLIKLVKETNLPIILLPMGRAALHEDQKALRMIKSRGKIPCYITSKNSIYDIMLLIANAKIFIGTSLHGIITAMSFGIPYLSIGPHIGKVKRYLQTWSNIRITGPVEYSKITWNAINVLKLNKNEFKKEHNKILIEAERNFDQIANCLK